MKNRTYSLIWAIIAALSVAGAAHAQTDLFRTKVVDKTGNPTITDFATIQEAVDDVPITPGERWTILIYPGTYDEELALPLGKEIDLVGVDREAVIIAPLNTIQSAAILCSGKNSIRNLTLRPSNNNGIRLVSDCEVKNVTVDVSSGTARDGIILGAAGAAVHRVSIERCIVKARQRAIWDREDLSTDIVVRDCHLETDGSGSGTVAMAHAQRTLFENCTILNDGSNAPNENPVAFLIEGLGGIPFDILVKGCLITAIGAGVSETIAVQNTLDPGLRLLNCKITAEVKHATSGGEGSGAIGVDGRAIVIGGEIITSAVSDKATEVWDLREDANPASGQDMFMSGTLLSKWKGPISRPAPQGKKSVVQRTLNVPAASTTAIRTEITLDPNEQTVAPTGQPGAYRVLTVTGNQAGMNQPVYIIGADWADNKIVEKITLNGTSTVLGKKPFKTVTEIIFPPRNMMGDEVKVGTSTRLGLYVPIELIGDVVEQSHLVPSGTAWIVGSVGFAAVDFIYATVDVGSFPTGTGFRLSVLTAK
ncbi:MAG: right-handed parallel beta-helix repeat-containing protein [Armatimonadetes bacterium]|nr:right-handed parallel beta-helix repeat-containing protein [Armatimonadota bacterium]